MKRYIKAVTDDEIFLEDTIEIVISIDQTITSAKDYNLRFDKYTTLDNLRKEIAELLTKKYKFNVVTEDIDGSKQKGWITNREDSNSIYFNTFYDLKNAKWIASEFSIPFDKVRTATKVKCFIHLSFSDHNHSDLGDPEHKRFIEHNFEEHTTDDVNLIIKEDRVEMPNSIITAYEEGIIELEYNLKQHIGDWVRRYNLKH